MIAPCKNCTDRVMGCHSKCEKYLAFHKENELVKENRRKIKALDALTIPRERKWK